MGRSQSVVEIRRRLSPSQRHVESGFKDEILNNCVPMRPRKWTILALTKLSHWWLFLVMCSSSRSSQASIICNPIFFSVWAMESIWTSCHQRSLRVCDVVKGVHARGLYLHHAQGHDSSMLWAVTFRRPVTPKNDAGTQASCHRDILPEKYIYIYIYIWRFHQDNEGFKWFRWENECISEVFDIL